MKWKQSYRGWLIEIIPMPKGYLFQCWLPDEKTGFSDRQIYPTFTQAFAAAKKRADLEAVSLALIRFLSQSYEPCNLSSDEYKALETSIVNFVQQASRTQMHNSPTLLTQNQILCFYKNTTSQIQILRISHSTNCDFEQIVFPGEQMLFEAFPQAELEIHMDSTTGATLTNKILCSNLEVYG